MSRPPSSRRQAALAAHSDPVALGPLTAQDWAERARAIYQQGVDGGDATFETRAPDWQDWTPARSSMPAIAARSGAGELIGWAALSPVSARRCYRGVGSVSIYVDRAQHRRGVGARLLAGLIEVSEQAGFWTLEAGIFPQNTASIALHESQGFRRLGTRERVGQMPDGSWRDVLVMERRSTLVGVGG